MDLNLGPGLNSGNFDTFENNELTHGFYLYQSYIYIYLFQKLYETLQISCNAVLTQLKCMVLTCPVAVQH